MPMVRSLHPRSGYHVLAAEARDTMLTRIGGARGGATALSSRTSFDVGVIGVRESYRDCAPRAASPQHRDSPAHRRWAFLPPALQIGERRSSYSHSPPLADGGPIALAHVRYAFLTAPTSSTLLVSVLGRDPRDPRAGRVDQEALHDGAPDQTWLQKTFPMPSMSISVGLERNSSSILPVALSLLLRRAGHADSLIACIRLSFRLVSQINHTLLEAPQALRRPPELLQISWICGSRQHRGPDS